MENLLLLNNDIKIIAISGGTGSGKTFLSKKLLNKFSIQKIDSIKVDSYYKDLSNLNFDTRKKTNFDHPKAFDFELLNKHLLNLKSGKSINSPIYDYKTHTRTKETKKIKETIKIILLEGIFSLYNEKIRRITDYSIYIDINEKTRLNRRIIRDKKYRKRTEKDIIQQYNNTVKPMYEKFIEPTKKFADIIIKKIDETDNGYIKLQSVINKYIT